MPYSETVWSYLHWKLCIHGDDHPPPHVHCKWEKKEKEIVITLDTLEVKHSQNVKEREISALKVLVEEQHELLIEAWNKINGEAL